MIQRNYVYLAVRPETKKDLMVSCMDEYLKHHSEMLDIPLSQNKMLKIVCNFYLETK